MRKVSVSVLSLAVLYLAWAASARAHELQGNRATLVLRDQTHVAVTLFINYPEALHQALAPLQRFSEFALVYSAMKPEDFQKDLLRAEAKFQSAMKIQLSPGVPAALTNWMWPDAKQVQAMLQQRVMQAVVDPNGHGHDAPLEVHADALARREIASVRVQFPEEFGKVLVVAFRPTQVWAEQRALSPEIRF